MGRSGADLVPVWGRSGQLEKLFRLRYFRLEVKTFPPYDLVAVEQPHPANPNRTLCNAAPFGDRLAVVLSAGQINRADGRTDRQRGSGI